MSNYNYFQNNMDLFPAAENNEAESSLSPEESVEAVDVMSASEADAAAPEEAVALEEGTVGEDQEQTEAPSEAEAPTETEAPAEEVADDSTNLPYYRRYYLLYGNKELPEYIDPAGTLSFLRGTLKYSGGELAQARKSKQYEENEGDCIDYCSYCGVPISGADYHRLPDGRKRCTNCNRSLVKSLVDLNAIFKEVSTNLEIFFGATLDTTITLQMVEERKLKKKIKQSLDKPGKNILILGCAVDEKKKGFTVYLENGAPRLSVIATLAHELTHIWQYTHWDRKALKKKYGKNLLVVYEGMAMWCEVQYLYHIGELNTAKRREILTRTRQDEYGIGFSQYVDQYGLSTESMSFLPQTPFSAGADPLDPN